MEVVGVRKWANRRVAPVALGLESHARTMGPHTDARLPPAKRRHGDQEQNEDWARAHPAGRPSSVDELAVHQLRADPLRFWH